MEYEIKKDPTLKLDEIVKMLLDYQKDGKKVFYNFNGHILHSENISYDSAYLEVTGMTRKEFKEKQDEVLEKINKQYEELLAKEMEKEVEVEAQFTLDKSIEMLLDYQKKGKKVFCNFNGHILHSENISYDSAYLEVFGETKAEYQAKKEKWITESKRKDEEFLISKDENAKKWFIEGSKYIYPEKENSWMEYCKFNTNDTIFHGKLIEEIIKIMAMIDSCDDISKAVEYYNKENYSGYVSSIISENVIKFSKKGPEFARELIKGKEDLVGNETLQYIEELEQQNKSFEGNNPGIKK